LQGMLKVCVVGDAEVGKSSLVASFVAGEPTTTPTARSRMYKKTLRVGDRELQLLIWDASSLDPKLDGIIKGSRVVYLVVDVTRYETLESLPAWVSKIRELEPRAEIVVVANKADRKYEAQFWEEELRELAQRLGFRFAFTSALDPEDGGVREAFLLPFS